MTIFVEAVNNFAIFKNSEFLHRLDRFRNYIIR